jgi:putative phosphoesterase
MRLALISDIHGNAVALRAVLADIERVGVDEVICLGDVATLGATPAAAVDIVRDLGCRCIMGNHDEFLIDAALIHTYTESPEVVAGVDWAREQLDSHHLDFLGTFEPTIELELEMDIKAVLFHGSPHSHMDDIRATTSAEDIDHLLGDYDADLMAGGHTHVQMLRQHRGTLVINPGSVGMPFKDFVPETGPVLMLHAEYGIVDVANGVLSVDLRRVAVDIDELKQAAADCDSPLGEFIRSLY